MGFLRVSLCGLPYGNRPLQLPCVSFNGPLLDRGTWESNPPGRAARLTIGRSGASETGWPRASPSFPAHDSVTS